MREAGKVVEAARSDDARASEPAPAPAPAPAKWALFAEMMLVGAIVLVLALPIVTVLPALAAGVRHLHRHAAARSDTVRLLLADLRRLIPGVWPLALALPGTLALLLLNLDIVTATAIPGGGALRWITAAIAAAAVVFALRTAGARAMDSAATTWVSAMRCARERWSDVAGNLLLLAAAAVSGVVVWMLPALVLVVPGMLTFAVLAVEVRTADRQNPARR